jgi:hypothetical protein
VRIGTAMRPTALLQYNTFRAATSLYSTRSEPCLGSILGNGWCDPEKWGARMRPGRADVHIRHFCAVCFFELLINITPISPRRLTVRGVTLELSRPAAGFRQWLWIGTLDNAMPGVDIITIEFDDGELELEEVVFYSGPLPPVARHLRGSATVLIPTV